MTLYRLATILALPVLVAAALRNGGRAEAAERLALQGGPGPVLWLHGASNGEIAAARWLVELMVERWPEGRILITANNPTARTMVRGWRLARVEARLAPLDDPATVGRFLRRWRPSALLTLENELWPGRLAGCAAAGVPVLILGARMSDRSARGWARLAPGMLARMLRGVAWLSAQDELSERRLVAAGLPRERLAPRLVLKARTDLPPAEPPFPAPPRARCLLAASTHEGEDGPILDAFRAARDRFDLLVIAPRHPRRGPAIAALAAARGLAAVLRSRGETPDGPVYVADTLGEMALWYRMCGVTIVGGTFVPKGGHTPYEPMAAGSALLHGPSVENFAEVFAALDAAGGALRVADGADLSAALAGLAPERQAALAAAANDLRREGTDPGPLLAALDGLLARG